MQAFKSQLLGKRCEKKCVLVPETQGANPRNLKKEMLQCVIHPAVDRLVYRYTIVAPGSHHSSGPNQSTVFFLLISG